MTAKSLKARRIRMGSDLNAADRAWALATFPNRLGMSDDEWLACTRFPVRWSGKVNRSAGQCTTRLGRPWP